MVELHPQPWAYVLFAAVTVIICVVSYIVAPSTIRSRHMTQSELNRVLLISRVLIVAVGLVCFVAMLGAIWDWLR